MFCKRCGADLPEGAIFCPKCGVEQRTMESAGTENNPNHANPSGAEIERIHFDVSSTYTAEKPTKNKAPIFIIAGLGIVLLAAVSVLVTSVFGSRNAKKVVDTAVQKTIQILQEEVQEASFSKKNEFGYSFEMTGNYYRSSYQSNELMQLLEELDDLRIVIQENPGKTNQDTYGSIEVGAGDMKNIRLNYSVGKDGIYLSLPDLYSRAFFFSQELLEDATGTDVEEIYDREARENALHSLGTTLLDSYHELYKKAICTKTGKATLTEYRNVETTRYEVTVPAADYQLYLKNLPDRIEEDLVFINWLSEISSKQAVKTLLDSFREDIDQYRVPKGVDSIILGYIYVDQKGRMVQLEIPFENDAEGELMISFLGEENLSDYISIQLHMDDGYSEQKIAFLYQMWEKEQLQSASVDKKNCLAWTEENEEEFEMALIEILRNISDGKYLPSQYLDVLDEMLLSIARYSDFNSNDYSDYDGWDFELDYSKNGNPILEDDFGIYQIELIAPPDSKLDLDWSFSTMICFIDEDEEQDYYYEIVPLADDSTDRFTSERSYLLEGDYYKNVVFSEILQKEINGYLVYYQYCSYDVSTMTGSNTYYEYYAWVRLDENYVFELYIDDYSNSINKDILDGCFQSVLPVQ